MALLERINEIWQILYPDTPKVFEELQEYLITTRQTNINRSPDDHDWFKNAVVYSLYVDLFADDFIGLGKKLDYFVELGIDTLWLLPVLKSPRKDCGFDVSDYFSIEPSLLDHNGSKPSPSIFPQFIRKAHARNIKIIFDIPLNHCSSEHPFFRDTRDNPHSPYQNYFIWSDTDRGFQKARIIFKGLMKSNWTFHPTIQKYYFHRFYEFQPDWNYKNPQVMFYILRILCHWKLQGVDGFRLDAIPYLWKEENTDCENLTNTHLIIQLIRAAMDYVFQGTLLLAEACQPPNEVVKYFGTGDEVQAAYHFPLMPQIYNAIAQHSPLPIVSIMDQKITPEIPSNCCWFVFLRCHDELTLEMVSPSDRQFLFKHYCHDPAWNFREGEGISARLTDLFRGDVCKILLAFSILLTIEGTPVIYYGSEFGMGNDRDFFEKMTNKTGYHDSRHLVRGPVNWKQWNILLQDPTTSTHRLNKEIKKMLKCRQQSIAPFNSKPQFISISESILSYRRQNKQGQQLCFLHNLSDQNQIISLTKLSNENMVDLLTMQCINNQPFTIPAHGVLWLAPVS